MASFQTEVSGFGEEDGVPEGVVGGLQAKPTIRRTISWKSITN
jgi:hypothetical protein